MAHSGQTDRAPGDARGLGGLAKGILARRRVLATPTSTAELLLAQDHGPERVHRSVPPFPGMLSEPPGAAPHAGWCGRGQGEPGLYPILREPGVKLPPATQSNGCQPRDRPFLCGTPRHLGVNRAPGRVDRRPRGWPSSPVRGIEDQDSQRGAGLPRGYAPPGLPA